ncbi:MAG: LysR family transcriptional regulator [Enterobacteriaceae bacterium]|jgi:DNA-binding transcriptional LysR family regulator|uniref:LysR family transcriptional regulator n=1 Tax=Kluyvera intermedia TaxID=61648 RepID=A0ABX3U932_KLUIN|nr:LysR family transcriptional regulator [Kluyvera intermedia]MDU6682756.1 LysR family transcriptional regulator [Enterobacteriaceae bacterium]ORJ48043.1 LysR family transcriptional regulator [Kluyvera intermedia]HAU8265401.1 LysR family transcriptional regulator [Kluyvera intermedia]
MERISDISLFLRVVDLGSISAAARSENLSLAVASKRIQRLEESLGARLLNRTTRRLYPTPEGELLASQGRPLIEALNALGECLHTSRSEVTGTIRVTMSASFGRLFISPLLAEFQSLHPDVNFVAHLSDEVVDLVKGGYDLAIRIGNLKDSSLVARRIAPNRRVLVASPSYLARRGVPQHPADLATHDGLLMTDVDGKRDIWKLITPEEGIFRVKINSKIESNFGELLRDAAVYGRGISLQSVWHVADDLNAGRLQVILPDYPLQESHIHAVTPTRLMQTPRIKAFIDFLQEKFAESALWER